MTTASTQASACERKLREDLQLLCDMHNAVPGHMTGYDCPECDRGTRH